MHRRHGTILLAAVLLLFCSMTLPSILPFDAPWAELQAQESPSPGEGGEPDDGPASGNDSSPTPTLEVVVKLESPLPDDAMVGQPLELDFRIEHPARAVLDAPDSTSSSRYAIARSDLALLSSPEQGPHISTLHLTLLPVRAGTASFADLKLDVRGEAGERVAITLLPDELKFGSSLGREDGELRPALPPKSIERPDYTPVKIAGGVLGLVVLTGLLLLGVRAMRPEPLPPPPPAIDDVALEALQSLAQQPPSSDPETVQFYTKMSEVMRDYLGQRYGFPGTEYTTSEILSAIPIPMLPPALGMSEIAQWLRASDRVKFSNSRPDTEEALVDLRKAIAMVELTRPPRESEVVLAEEREVPEEVEWNQSEGEVPSPGDEVRSPQEEVVQDREDVAALEASLGSMSWEELSALAGEGEEDGEEAEKTEEVPS